MSVLLSFSDQTACIFSIFLSSFDFQMASNRRRVLRHFVHDQHHQLVVRGLRDLRNAMSTDKTHRQNNIVGCWGEIFARARNKKRVFRLSCFDSFGVVAAAHSRRADWRRVRQHGTWSNSTPEACVCVCVCVFVFVFVFVLLT